VLDVRGDRGYARVGCVSGKEDEAWEAGDAALVETEDKAIATAAKKSVTISNMQLTGPDREYGHDGG